MLKSKKKSTKIQLKLEELNRETKNQVDEQPGREGNSFILVINKQAITALFIYNI